MDTAREDPYLTFLRGRADRKFFRAPYPGNAGDSLIQFATQHVLERVGIRTTMDPGDADVILIPGGNPTMWPDIGPRRWEELATRYPRAELVVGPAGFRNGYSDWIRVVNAARSNVSGLFARDPDSFRALETAKLRSGVTFGLSHDPALSLRGSNWLQAHLGAATAEYDLAAFRDDHETDLGHAGAWRAAHWLLPHRLYRTMTRRRASAVRARHLALARSAASGATMPLRVEDVSRQRLEMFVEAIRAARTVHTDRLHVMLLAVMLGKKVFAYPTAHSKLEGVYRHSLAGWADVTLVGA